MATYDKVYELAKALRESQEYREYQEAKRSVQGNEDALSILRDYQRRRLEYEMDVLSGKEPDPSKKAALDKISAIVEMHGPVKRFLDAERRIMVMMSDIQRILTDSLDLLDYS
mgnify:CR=1 FL=1